MWKALSWKIKLGLIAGLLVVAASLFGSGYFIGHIKGVQIAANEINRYQIASQRIQNSIETLQRTVDVKTVTVYKDRVAYIDRVQYRTKTVIETAVPEQFQLSKGWIYVYNQSVAGAEVNSELAADGERSGVSDRAALLTAAENNTIALKNATQLESLQNWIRDTEAARAEATKK